MSILWVGTSIADFELAGGPIAVTNATHLATGVAEGIETTWYNSGVHFYPPTDLTEFWLHWSARYQGTGPTGNPVPISFLLRSRAFPLIRFAATANNTLSVQVRNGAGTNVQVGTLTFLATPSGVEKFDMYIKIHPTEGRIVWYRDGTIIFDYTGQTDFGYGGIGSIQLVATGGNTSYLSAVILADEDTRTLELSQKLPTGDGYIQEWTGGYADIDETGRNDADFITTGLTNKKSTFTFPAQGAETTGRSVDAVFLGARGRGASAQSIQGVARTSSIDTMRMSDVGVTPDFGSVQFKYELNPVTGEPWTLAEINAAQFGVRSA